MITAEQLEAFRQRHELSIRELARLAGVSKSTIQRWLSDAAVSRDSFREAALRQLIESMDRQRRKGRGA